MTDSSWREVPIGEVIAGLYDGPHATPKPADSGPVFLGIKNVTEDGFLDLTAIRHIAEEDYSRWTKRVEPQPGDLVFTYEATLNRYAIIPEGFRGCLGRRMALIRPDEDKAHGRFLYYAFFGPKWRATIEGNKLSGATVERIPLTNFPDFPVLLPPLPTQRRIAAILSAYDDLIEVNTRRIAILEEMARRVYEEWFGKFSGPRDRSIITLGQVFELHRGKSYRSAELGQDEQGLPLLNLKNIAAWGGFRRDGTKRFTGEYKARHIATSGDILMAVTDMTQERRLVAQAARVPTAAGPEAVFSMDLLKCVPRECDRTFGYALLRWSGCADHLKEHANGANVLHLSPKVIERFEVTMPPAAEQERYSNWASPVFALMDTLEDQNTNLRAQRDLLLPRLVSGKLSLDEAERQAEETAA